MFPGRGNTWAHSDLCDIEIPFVTFTYEGYYSVVSAKYMKLKWEWNVSSPEIGPPYMFSEHKPGIFAEQE